MTMAALGPITYYRITGHARGELARRQISETDAALVLASPGQTAWLRVGRAVYQSIVEMGDPPRKYLLRVIVDVDRQPAEVVTAYRTSKIEKYWRPAK